MELYREQGSNPKYHAQRNLQGRTHYVDDDTLRFHKSRVLSARIVDGGLLFAIVTSDALDYNNTKRGYRYVVFDVFGKVLSRVDLEDAFKTAAAATKAMWKYLDTIDATAHTLKAIEEQRIAQARELDDFAAKVRGMQQKMAA